MRVERADPNPRTNPAGVIWSLCAQVFLGTYGNPKNRKAHIYGILCYTKENGNLGWLAVTKAGIICQEAGYKEVPLTYLDELKKTSKLPKEWDTFLAEAKTYPGWSSADLKLP